MKRIIFTFVSHKIHNKPMRYILKSWTALLSMVLIVAFASCSSSNDDPGEPEPQDSPSLLLTFSINGVTADINPNTLEVTVVLPGVSDFTKLVPSYKVTQGYVRIENQDVTSGQTAVDFSNPVTLTTINGNAQKKYKLTVKNTGLPIVEIKTVSEVKSKDVWQEGASMTIRLADGTIDFEGPMSIRGRGNSTWNYPKKPYALKLENKSKILGMAKHKRWILLANWKDRTLLRNDAAFWLSKQTDLAYTVNGQFVELVMNGKLMGNYYLCEQIKIDKNRLDIAEMEPKETVEKLITGGYLMELDTYYDEVNKFKSEKFNLPFQFKQPDEEELSSAAYLYMKNYISQLEDILADETRLQNHEYEAYLDVDSSIDWFFVHELATNTEPYSSYPWNGPHSCYMYKDRDGKLMSGPVWDFDYHGFCPQFANQWQCTKAIYYPALLKDEKYRKRMRERWDMLKGKFQDFPKYVDEKVREIGLSESVNIKMWPINNNENGDETMTYDQAIERMKKAFQTKFEFLDKNL